jgi:hypothetical protein
MTQREKSPGGLIFEALCLRFRSTTNIRKTMTRQELQDATGLTVEALVDALRVLVAPVNEDHAEARMIAAISTRKGAILPRRLWPLGHRVYSPGGRPPAAHQGADGRDRGKAPLPPSPLGL